MTYKDKDGEKTEVFDKLIVAVGRRPYTEGRIADDAGIQMADRGFVHVDDVCQTSVPGVYAIGDLVRGPMLAHRLGRGRYGSRTHHGKPAQVNYDTVPSGFTPHPK